MIEPRRDKQKDHAFTYRGNAIGKLNNSAWKRTWRLVGLPTEKGILKGVHNLPHAFGKRLRGAGVPFETRKALLGHVSVTSWRIIRRQRFLNSSMQPKPL
jgi:integrase